MQYVVQLAKERNFSRAAEKLHIAQPSLSQQLSKLENELGVLLFCRTTNSVEPTHAGTVFMEKAEAILDAVEQLRQEMDDLAQMRKGKLIVGSLPITGSHVLPHVLPVFRARYPEIEVTLVEDTTSRLEQLTAVGQTDLSLLSLPLGDPSLTWEPLIEEEILLAVPPRHPLAERSGSGVEVSELAGEPFIVLKKGQGFRKIALDLCRGAGIEPRIVFESGNIETVQSLVAAGMGLAFVPQMVARPSGTPLSPVYLRLASAPTRTLVIASRIGRYRSKAARAFIETLRETAPAAIASPSGRVGHGSPPA